MRSRRPAWTVRPCAPQSGQADPVSSVFMVRGILAPGDTLLSMAPALRVLLLGNYLPPRGGAEVHLADADRILRGAGHAVELLVPGAAGGWPDLRDRVYNPGVRRLVRAR